MSCRKVDKFSKTAALKLENNYFSIFSKKKNGKKNVYFMKLCN